MIHRSGCQLTASTENVGDSRQKSTPRLDRTRRQHGFKIGAAQGFRAELDNFGRRPFEREPLKKVGIFGQKRPAVAASMIPDQLVGGLLTQGGGMQAGILSGLKPKTGCLKSHPLRIRGKKRLGRFRVLRVFRGHSSVVRNERQLFQCAFKMSRTPVFCRSPLAGDFTFHRLTTSWVAREQAPASKLISPVLGVNWN